MLKELETEQALLSSMEDNLVDLHLFMTSAVKKSNMEGVGLHLALDLAHRRDSKDFFTGLEARTQPGRPDWDKVILLLLLRMHENGVTVTVFFILS